MDSFTVNKIAGAVLGTCVVGMGIGILAQGYFEGPSPKKPGYELPNPKPEAEAGAEKKAPEAPLPVLLAKADVKKGEANAKVCTACHNFEEGAGAKVGPDLYGVVGRPKGSVAGFDYSAGMKAKGGTWTFADLNEFITKPSAYVQGTKMGYAGEDNPQKRADIIVYLRSLSKDPVPLPPVTDADKKTADAGGDAKPAGEAAAAGGDAELIKAIAESDPKKGQADAQVCSACHNFKKGAGALVGPDLWGVVDRPKGSVAGFDYSAGMKAKGGTWTYADLNQFLTKPQAYVKGTKMGFAGEDNPKKRAEIIAFLRTLADTPAPLPGGDTKPDQAKAQTGDSDKAVVPGAKPGNQSPPPPPNKPDAPQPEPKLPEASNAAGAPSTPTPGVPPKPDAAAAPAPAASAPAEPAATGAAAEGPEPYAAPEPTDTAPAEPMTLPKMEASTPSLTGPGDDKASDTAPEPYAAPTPGDDTSGK